MVFQNHCRMAPLNQGGVVDSMGQVYGVQKLIVAGDSIVPVAMDGAPMATAYLIAANSEYDTWTMREQTFRSNQSSLTPLISLFSVTLLMRLRQLAGKQVIG
jgi:hypothetical protein